MKKLKWQQSDQKPIINFRLHSFHQTLESAIQRDLSTAVHTVPTGKSAELYTVQCIGQEIKIC